MRKLLIVLFLTGCATRPPDTEVCVELDPSRGFCTFTISDREFYIDENNPHDFQDGNGPQTWWSIRPAMVMVPPGSYAKLKSYVVKTCKQQKCDQQIGAWERRVKKLDEKIEERDGSPKQE